MKRSLQKNVGYDEVELEGVIFTHILSPSIIFFLHFWQTKQKELEKAQLPSGATGSSQNLPGSPVFQDNVDEKAASPSSPGELTFGTFPSCTGKNEVRCWKKINYN